MVLTPFTVLPVCVARLSWKSYDGEDKTLD